MNTQLVELEDGWRQVHTLDPAVLLRFQLAVLNLAVLLRSAPPLPAVASSQSLSSSLSCPVREWRQEAICQMGHLVWPRYAIPYLRHATNAPRPRNAPFPVAN